MQEPLWGSTGTEHVGEASSAQSTGSEEPGLHSYSSEETVDTCVEHRRAIGKQGVGGDHREHLAKPTEPSYEPWVGYEHHLPPSGDASRLGLSDAHDACPARHKTV